MWGGRLAPGWEKLMKSNDGQLKHRYRLVLADDLKGSAQRIELEAPNALRAMSLVQRSLSEREVELYEDEKPLGKLRYDARGHWTVLPFQANQI
jgi:hypothetical protein